MYTSYIYIGKKKERRAAFRRGNSLVCRAATKAPKNRLGCFAPKMLPIKNGLKHTVKKEC